MISLAVLESLQGGSLTSDAVLLIKEESSNPISSRTKASACKRQKVHADGSCKTQEETCSILAHRAVLWAMSEYFESKVGKSTAVACQARHQQQLFTMQPASDHHTNSNQGQHVAKGLNQLLCRYNSINWKPHQGPQRLQHIVLSSHVTCRQAYNSRCRFQTQLINNVMIN